MEKNRDYEDVVEVTGEQKETNDIANEIPDDYKPDMAVITAIQNSEVGRVEIKEHHKEAEIGTIEDLNIKDYKDIGIQDVPLDNIDFSDCPKFKLEDFHKVSYEEMQLGFDKLENVVKPTVEKGADVDYFRALDHSDGIFVKRGGYQEVYQAFYGGTSIKLQENDSGTYSIDNGYHRLFVAREMGIKSVPARVKIVNS